MKTTLLALLLLFVGLWILPSLPQAQAVEPTAAVVYLSGDDSVVEGKEFREGETISTTSGLTIKLPDGSDLELDQGTTVNLTRLPRSGARVTKLTLTRGGIRSRVTPTGSNGSYTVTTPVGTAGVRGTDFAVAYDPGPANAMASAEDGMELDVFEGEVAVEQEGKPEQRFRAGNGASVRRRAVRRREIAEQTRERWQERRESMIEKMRQRLNLGPNDDVAAKLRERLSNMTPEQREQIKSRLQQMQKEARDRAAARAAAVRERNQERRSERRAHDTPRPGRRR